jgi:cyclic beta-1,2-glucan synthetase
MQRAGVESILGLHVRGTWLHLNPGIPRAWPGFEMPLRHSSARYEIRIENPEGVGRALRPAQLDEKGDRGAAVTPARCLTMASRIMSR